VGQFDVEAALRRHLMIPPCRIAMQRLLANNPQTQPYMHRMAGKRPVIRTLLAHTHRNKLKIKEK
jgi:hypothetical protein